MRFVTWMTLKIFRQNDFSILKTNLSSLRMNSHASKKRKVIDRIEDRVIWVDLEGPSVAQTLMSGLDYNFEHILEMACIVTDADLNVVAESDDVVIHQPDAVLDNMDDWCKEHHGQSGLTEAVRKSKISLHQAEDKFLEFVQKHTLKGKSPLAGNSVHADRAFLVKYMPKFAGHLHYRIIDVSTIKELTRRWYPEEFLKADKKRSSHRALDDIKESIAELKYYQDTVFKPYIS